MVMFNCDMGEAFGLYKMGDDAGLMPQIDVANVACGFHGSDFNHMRETVRLAKRHGVKVGAHPSLPDLQGFGRREMKIGREELTNCLLYQIGALRAFLDAEGVALNHIKPHGALYGMAARMEDIAEAVADAADVYKVPLFGMKGTLHEKVYQRRGHTFVAEYYADLDYNAEGGLIITREHEAKDPTDAAARCLRAITEGKDAKCCRKRHPRRIRFHLRPLRHSECRRHRRSRSRGRPSPSRSALKRGPQRSNYEELMAIQQILSPLPGIFYRKPAPGEPDYKSDGDTVTQDDTVGLVEVMKSFNEVKAGAAGKIVRFLIENEDAVMAGKPIAEIDV
jgi:UPF0271 protein